MRKLQGDYSISLQQDLHTLYETAKVRHLCEHIVAEQEIGLRAVAHQFLSQLSAKKFHQRVNSFASCNRGNVRGWLNTYDWNTSLSEILKQITVIAGQFHDSALGVQLETLNH